MTTSQRSGGRRKRDHVVLVLGGGNVDRKAEANFQRYFARAFGHWQHVEWELLGIFQTLMLSKQPGVTAKAFRAIINFRAQVQATDAAAQFIVSGFAHDLLSKWNTLADHLLKQAKRRNKIAHYRTIYVRNDETGKAVPMLENPERPMEGIEAKQLMEWGDSFLNLANEAFEFKMALVSKPLFAPGYAFQPRPSPYKLPPPKKPAKGSRKKAARTPKAP